MEPARFDRLARDLATNPLSRRSALRGGSAGLAGLVAGALTTRAQGTPVSGDELAADNGTLFVQTAAGGTFLPNAMATPDGTAHGSHLLTLSGHPGQTIGFSDRPQRNFGSVDTATFLTTLGFAPENPPNAALLVSTPAGEDDVLVLELLNPSYDDEGDLLIYEANILAEYAGTTLAPVADRQQDLTLASEFAHASLFIDDCPDATPLICSDAWCDHLIGSLGNRGMCWSWSNFRCEPCSGGFEGTAQECNATFDECARFEYGCSTVPCGPWS